jgi:hypothetical protein
MLSRFWAISRRLWRAKSARIALVAGLVVPGVLVSAQAAQASWLQQTTAPLGGSTTWSFNDVSCTSPNFCMTVGTWQSGTQNLIAERRTPTGWTVTVLPEPTPGSQLLSISCPAAKSCVAVGFATFGTTERPLAERWNGTGWAIASTAKPTGFTNSELTGVSCASAGSCMAVGWASKGARSAPFAERLSHGHWQLLPVPVPPRSRNGELNGVSCPAATRCLAVGTTDPHTDEALAESWNGAKWTVQSIPGLSGSASVTILNGVSCSSAKSCVAVGDNVAERWNGSKWTMRKPARPDGRAGDMSDVSCVRAGVCYAAGSIDIEGIQNSAAEYWNGSAWSAQGVPLSTSSDTSYLSGVSCTTTTNCTAVGGYHDPVDGERGLAEDFTVRWQDASPLPFNGVVATALNGVSCARPQTCVAVGTFETTGSVFEAFSDTWSGGSWFSALPPDPKISNLSGISCVSTSFCIAVGDIIRGGIPNTLTERWTGAGWIIQKSPSPADPARSFLGAVSCQSAKACSAVGFYTGHHGKQFTLAEQWNGSTWKIERTSTATAGLGTSLTAVSCPAASSCEAVGTGPAGPLIEQWNGKSWAVRKAGSPKGGKDGSLAGVSCAAAAACTAVGGYVHGSRVVPLAERWNGTSWRVQTAPAVPGSKFSGLTAVSCPSAGACEATAYANSSAVSATSERWNGNKWSVHPITAPSGAESDDLVSLSCTSKVNCLAVGYYNDSSAVEQMLAEQYS